MVYNALFAFSAADDAVNVSYSSRATADQLTHTFYSKALRLLSARMEAHAAGDRRESNVPLLFTIFLLAIYGVCIHHLETRFNSNRCRPLAMTVIP